MVLKLLDILQNWFKDALVFYNTRLSVTDPVESGFIPTGFSEKLPLGWPIISHCMGRLFLPGVFNRFIR